MNTQTTIETLKESGSQVLDTVKELVHAGNIRRIIVRQGDAVVAEFPLTVGVVGTLISPVLAALGALVALLAECTIQVEQVHEKPATPSLILPHVDTEMHPDVPTLDEMAARL